jgi:hypothetical protein
MMVGMFGNTCEPPPILIKGEPEEDACLMEGFDGIRETVNS